MPAERMVVAPDGVTIAARFIDGDLPVTLAFAHATGFCQALWNPVIEELSSFDGRYPVVTWDHRGHGRSDPPPGEVDWWDLARDALRVLTPVGRPLVGVGHSAGAAALLKAEILEPGRFDSIVAIEPIVFPPPYGSGHDHPLARSARRRRRTFASRREARENFLTKPVFAGWDRRALDAYVECGLVDDDQGVRLACDPDIEGAFYAAAGLHQAWERLGEVTAPVVLVGGASSDSHPEEFLERQRAELPSASVVVEPGAGHFLPMENPGRTAELVVQVARTVTESTNSS